ncbi:MAG: PilT/PilU family type 4a pilus ATPase [Candidatus Taylorbacteria bacterium]|nr:PilT/PilU family type 4a pilus ATPase [Candidatus Taylorbacteria bacterium]
MNMPKELLSALIEQTIREGASDLHLLVNRHPVIRVAGALVPLVKHPILTPADIASCLEEFLSEQDNKLFLQQKEIDFSYSFKDAVRFRGNAYFEKGNAGVALRLIPTKIPSLEELRLPQMLEEFTKKQQGFFLVVGPMGHGKSTTLASLIELINTSRSEHIMTIEDPIEYIYEEKLSVIDQREVRIDTKDFRTALVSMFREDVDVALIGEMRDQETIASAVTAAETGHLVFSTLHTNNAAQSIDRIIDIFPPGQQEQIRLQLAASLTGVFSQRLVPRISGGLVPAFELLIANNAVANLIREKRTHEINTVIETGLEQGMIDMNRSLADLVRRGEITPENAFAYSPNPQMMERLL